MFVSFHTIFAVWQSENQSVFYGSLNLNALRYLFCWGRQIALEKEKVSAIPVVKIRKERKEKTFPIHNILHVLYVMAQNCD